MMITLAHFPRLEYLNRSGAAKPGVLQPFWTMNLFGLPVTFHILIFFACIFHKIFRTILNSLMKLIVFHFWEASFILTYLIFLEFDILNIYIFEKLMPFYENICTLLLEFDNTEQKSENFCLWELPFKLWYRDRIQSRKRITLLKREHYMYYYC